jgi:hypothetical protein
MCFLRTLVNMGYPLRIDDLLWAFALCRGGSDEYTNPIELS